MIVYSDLATRASALNPALDFIGINEFRPRTDADVVRNLDGLHRGWTSRAGCSTRGVASWPTAREGPQAAGGA